MAFLPGEAALTVDLYELTMAESYLREGMGEQATFDLFVRTLPEHRNFLLTAGLEQALEYLEKMRFDDEAVSRLRQLGVLSERLLSYLRTVRFTGEVWAMQEGEVAFAAEPILRIQAPILEAQLVESWLLSCITFQTMIASKAARVALACQGRPFVEFGLRRAHGPQAALWAARAAFVGGAAATSNVLAATSFGIRPSGTMAHSFITAFGDEEQAFRSFAQDHGERTTLLIDTYDTLEGARRASRVGAEMRARGQSLYGVRLDSGDPLKLAPAVRQILDDAGLHQVRIILSGDLDERIIARLVDARVPVDAFGVGTQLDTSADAPSLGGVYKLSEYAGVPRMKLSAHKVTLPGTKQVYRREVEGQAAGDLIALAEEPPPEGRPLLQRVMQGGLRTAPPEPLRQIQARARERIAALPAPLRSLEDGARYPVGRAPRLCALTAQLTAELSCAVTLPERSVPAPAPRRADPRPPRY